MRLLISGSRGWHNEAAIESVIQTFMEVSRQRGEEFVLIHGHAKSGADILADRIGKRLGLVIGETLIRVPADWKRYKEAAGPIRNQCMLDEFHPDLIHAFRAAGKSNGTDDMIARAQEAGVETHVHFDQAFSHHNA